MKAPEKRRSRPARIARTAGYAVAALAYLTLLMVAAGDAGLVAVAPGQDPSQVEIAAQLR